MLKLTISPEKATKMRASYDNDAYRHWGKLDILLSIVNVRCPAGSRPVADDKKGIIRVI